jgi:ABC-type sugar transport system substrate-binding protein
MKAVLMWVVAAIAGLALVGCGSSSSSSSSSSGGSSSTQASTSQAASSPDVKQAQAVVKGLMAPPKPPTVEPLSKRPPQGKTVALIDCPVPGCKLLYKAAVPAASLLGWKVHEIDGGSTPQTYVAAMQAALQSHPDYIMLTALQPNSTIAPELAEAKTMHIPIWEVSASSNPTGAIVSSFFGPGTYKLLGQHLADWITAESNGHANAVFFTDHSATSYLTGDNAFKAEISKICSGCQVDYQQYSQLNIGQSFPSQVVSYVQAHPDVQYLVCTTSGAWLGVPQALKAAGLANKVKLVAALSTQPDYALVQQNDPSYTVLAVNQSGGYYGIDAFARASVGDPVPLQPVLAEQFITPQTVNTFNNKEQWALPNIAQAFAKTWHVKIPAHFVAQEP